jgi:hypothetical protein
MSSTLESKSSYTCLRPPRPLEFDPRLHIPEMEFSCGNCDGVAIHGTRTDPVTGYSLFKLAQMLSCDLKGECRRVLWGFFGSFFLWGYSYGQGQQVWVKVDRSLVFVACAAIGGDLVGYQ